VVEGLWPDPSRTTRAPEAPGSLESVWSRPDGPRRVAARVAVALETSSTWLREMGRVTEAERATRWASWQRLAAESPGLVRPLFGAVTDAAALEDDAAFLERALQGAISMAGADFGNIQLSNDDGSLRIAAQLGFGEDFLDHFARVTGDSSACGRAASSHAQTVISDVRRDLDFAPHRKIAAASGFRAVVSTPIVGPGGRLLGIVSTQFRNPRRASRQELLLADWYADRIGAALRARLSVVPRV